MQGSAVSVTGVGESIWWREFRLGPVEFEVLRSSQIALCKSSLEVQDWNLLYIKVLI